MRIRQIALVARDLEPVVAELCAVLGLEVCFRDPGVSAFGLHNALMAIGSDFLEVVSPIREGTAAGRLLEKRGGDGGYMVILQSDDLAADRARLEHLGVRVVWEASLSDIASIHLHPKDVGAAIVSLDQPRPPQSWRWGGPTWPDMPASDVTRELVGAEVQALNPAEVAKRWAQVLGRPARAAGRDGFELPLEPGRIRFVPALDGRGDGVAGIEVRAEREPVLEAARGGGLACGEDEVEIAGIRVRLL
jgi:hypothetical protein